MKLQLVVHNTLKKVQVVDNSMSVEYTDPPFPSCPTRYLHTKQKDLSLRGDCNLFYL